MRTRIARAPTTVACWFFAAAPLHAQQLGGGGGAEISFVRILAALVICIAAAFALVLAIRSRGGKLPVRFRHLGMLTRPGRIAIIETRRLSAQNDVCLFRCDGVEYLVLCGPGGFEVLDRREPQASAQETK